MPCATPFASCSSGHPTPPYAVVPHPPPALEPVAVCLLTGPRRLCTQQAYRLACECLIGLHRYAEADEVADTGVLRARMDADDRAVRSHGRREEARGEGGGTPVLGGRPACPSPPSLRYSDVRCSRPCCASDQALEAFREHAAARRTVSSSQSPVRRATPLPTTSANANATAPAAAAAAAAARGTFAYLPVELLIRAFRHLSFRTVLACTRVSRHWRAAAVDATLYSTLDLGPYAATVTNRVVDMLAARGSWALHKLDVSGCTKLNQAALVPLRKGACPNLAFLAMVRTTGGNTGTGAGTGAGAGAGAGTGAGTSAGTCAAATDLYVVSMPVHVANPGCVLFGSGCLCAPSRAASYSLCLTRAVSYFGVLAKFSRGTAGMCRRRS